MLTNEKYIGDALLQKTYTVDFLTKKRVKNDGIVPQYYVENSHEGIIPRDLFMQVQEEMTRRTHMNAGSKKRVYSSKYALSSIVYCSKCGDIYRRIVWNNRGKQSVVWRCCTRVEHGPKACNAETIREEELQEVTVKAFNQLYQNKESVSAVLMDNIKKVIYKSNNNLTLIDDQLKELQKAILKKANSNQKYDELVKEIYDLRDEKQRMIAEVAERNGLKTRITEMENFIKEFEFRIKEYDEQLVRTYIDKITVYENRYTVEFKAGFKFDIEK